MICERALGNVLADASGFREPLRHRDEVEIFWWELNRRALNKTTRDGRRLRIVLARTSSMSEGDVLFDDGGSIVVVRVPPADVLIVQPSDWLQAGLICLELGNLHIPVEITANEILVAADGPSQEVLDRHGVDYAREERLFQPRHCAGMPQVSVSPNFRVTR